MNQRLFQNKRPLLEFPVPVRNEFAQPAMAGPGETLAIGLLGLIFGIACYLLFFLQPDLDIRISSAFFNDGERFYLGKDPVVAAVRKTLLYFTGAFYFLVVVGWIVAYQKQERFLGFTWEKWAYLGISALAGPALLVNGILKANWGRARPRDTELFGGELDFTPFWMLSDQCPSNCSFTSGEVAATALIFFSLAMLLARPARYLVLVFGLSLAVLVAWIRIVMGGHYASDTVMSVSLMLIVVSETYYLFFLRSGNWIKRANQWQIQKLASKSSD